MVMPIRDDNQQADTRRNNQANLCWFETSCGPLLAPASFGALVGDFVGVALVVKSTMMASSKVDAMFTPTKGSGLLSLAIAAQKGKNRLDKKHEREREDDKFIEDLMDGMDVDNNKKRSRDDNNRGENDIDFGSDFDDDNDDDSH